MLLTPEFGPRVRVGIIITELELEPDPIMEPGTLCNRCMACVKECPGGCIPKDKTIKANINGRTLEWADVDMNKCCYSFRGADLSEEGERNDYIPGFEGFKPTSITPFNQKPTTLYNSGQAICGAKGCTRACMISLESRGLLKNKFENPFRTKKLWSVDWSQDPIDNGYVAPYEGTDSINARENWEKDWDTFWNPNLKKSDPD